MKPLHLFIIDREGKPSRIEVGPEDLSFLLYGARYSKENLAQANEIVTAVNSHDGLLEALEDLLDYMMNYPDHLLKGERLPREIEVYEKARAAIEKARPCKT